MKKITYSLIALLLAACGPDDVSQCKKIKNINWANRDSAIKIYKGCIGDAVDTPDDKLVSLPESKIDSMLYLSYIYLTDKSHYDWDLAIKMLNTATKSMLQKCQYASINGEILERYGNYCYHYYDFNKMTYTITPTPINTIDDAMFVYQMSMPCVYMDMIRENEDALKLIDAWFGSTRDLSIPSVCEYEISGKFIEFDDFFDATGLEYLLSLNSFGEIDGTIRFGYRTSNYHDFIYMMTYPTHFFKTDNLDDIYVERTAYCDWETDDADCNDQNIRITATDLESKILANSHAKRGYEKMKTTLEKYYITVLKMDAATAKRYARFSADKMLLNYIYMM